MILRYADIKLINPLICDLAEGMGRCWSNSICLWKFTLIKSGTAMYQSKWYNHITFINYCNISLLEISHEYIYIYTFINPHAGCHNGVGIGKNIHWYNGSRRITQYVQQFFMPLLYHLIPSWYHPHTDLCTRSGGHSPDEGARKIRIAWRAYAGISIIQSGN